HYEVLPAAGVARDNALAEAALGRQRTGVPRGPAQRHGIARPPARGRLGLNVLDHQIDEWRELRGHFHARAVVGLGAADGVAFRDRVGHVEREREAYPPHAVVAVRENDRRLPRALGAGGEHAAFIVDQHVADHLVGIEVAHDDAVGPRTLGRLVAVVARLPAHRDRAARIDRAV